MSELRIHILIINKAYKCLHNQHLYSTGNRAVETYSPIEAITNYSLFLNSTAMINKILGLSSRYDKPRAQELRRHINLDEKELKEIRLINLRNSIEHMDERLDEIEKSLPAEIVVWDLTDRVLNSKYVLRKFDPKNFTMQCIDQHLNLQKLDVSKCFQEVQYIESAINKVASPL